METAKIPALKGSTTITLHAIEVSKLKLHSEHLISDSEKKKRKKGGDGKRLPD